MTKKSKKSQEETGDATHKTMPQPTVTVTQEMAMSPEVMDMLKKSVDLVVDKHVRMKIDNLVQESVNRYFEKFGTLPLNIRIVEEGLREISLNDAKELIYNTIKLGDIFYPSDIAEKLNLDLKLVVDVINELKKEGKLKTAE